jgi:pimeloyl-ACP methyl ester carboxylesterase
MIKFIGNYRLTPLKTNGNSNFNWIFLPGGPGMGSKYLADFAKQLILPGSTYLVDFPGDGDNRNVPDINLKEWHEDLAKVAIALKPCIVVTHSFSGMLALSVRELEEVAAGLVILNSTPDNSWITNLAITAQLYNLPSTTIASFNLVNNPIDENLRLVFDACIPYLFAPDEIDLGLKLLDQCSFNAKTYLHLYQDFIPNFHHTWTPQNLPTLIIGSTGDKILPIKLFADNPNFARANITITELENNSHFPWLSDFAKLNTAFLEWMAENDIG